MVLDHERLDVYHAALDFLVFANEVIEALPRGRRHLSDLRIVAMLVKLAQSCEG